MPVLHRDEPLLRADLPVQRRDQHSGAGSEHRELHAVIRGRRPEHVAALRVCAVRHI